MTASREREWIDWVQVQLPETRQRALRLFCQQYFYFSTRQVLAFSAIFRVIGPDDRDALSELADVLHEELGRGKADRVHSVLLERFASAAGLSASELRPKQQGILPGVRRYVDELAAAFSSSVPRALAAYVFLETSAVETYGPLTKLFEACGYRESDMEFFQLHAKVEVEHAATAARLRNRYDFGASDLAEADEQTRRLSEAWTAFWSDILEASKSLAGERG